MSRQSDARVSTRRRVDDLVDLAQSLREEQRVDCVPECLRVVLELERDARRLDRELAVERVQAACLDELLERGPEVAASQVQVAGAGVREVVERRSELGEVEHLLRAR